jgi:hypothetical protein
LTSRLDRRIVIASMARIRTAERAPQVHALSSVGALACTHGYDPDLEGQPGRRQPADAGGPVVRW